MRPRRFAPSTPHWRCYQTTSIFCVPGPWRSCGSNRIDEAEEHLLRLSTECVSSAQDEWGLAAIDLLRGDLERAATRFQAVIARGPRAMRELDTALIYCQAGLFPAAAQHLAAARAAAPACARIRDVRARHSRCIEIIQRLPES